MLSLVLANLMNYEVLSMYMYIYTAENIHRHIFCAELPFISSCVWEGEERASLCHLYLS